MGKCHWCTAQLIGITGRLGLDKHTCCHACCVVNASSLSRACPGPRPGPRPYLDASLSVGQALLRHGSLGTGLACLVLLLAHYPVTAALLAVQLRGHHWASAWFAVPAYDAACLIALPYLQASARHAAAALHLSQEHTFCCRTSGHRKPRPRWLRVSVPDRIRRRTSATLPLYPSLSSAFQSTLTLPVPQRASLADRKRLCRQRPWLQDAEQWLWQYRCMRQLLTAVLLSLPVAIVDVAAAAAAEHATGSPLPPSGLGLVVAAAVVSALHAAQALAEAAVNARWSGQMSWCSYVGLALQLRGSRKLPLEWQVGAGRVKVSPPRDERHR